MNYGTDLADAARLVGAETEFERDLHCSHLRGTAVTKLYAAGPSVRVIAEISGFGGRSASELNKYKT